MKLSPLAKVFRAGQTGKGTKLSPDEAGQLCHDLSALFFGAGFPSKPKRAPKAAAAEQGEILEQGDE